MSVNTLSLAQPLLRRQRRLAVCAALFTAIVLGSPEVLAAEASIPAWELAPLARPAYGMSFAEGPAPAPGPRAPLLVAPPTGIGLIIGGSLTAGLFGAPFVGWGATTLSVASTCSAVSQGDFDLLCRSTRNVGIALLVPGLLAIAGGTTMIVFGAKRHSAYNQWKATNGIVLAPSFGATARRTPVYGLALSF